MITYIPEHAQEQTSLDLTHSEFNQWGLFFSDRDEEMLPTATTVKYTATCNTTTYKLLMYSINVFFVRNNKQNCHSVYTVQLKFKDNHYI